MEEIRRTLDPEALKSRATSMPYPHAFIRDINKCVPIVISALEEGDLPLVGTYKGATKIVKMISRTALNFHKLLRVTEVEMRFSQSDVSPVNDILDYMEVSQRWI